MKRVILTATCICLLAFITMAVSAQTQTTARGRVQNDPSGAAQEPLHNEIRNLVAVVERLSLEVSRLKGELSQLQLDNQQLKVKQLEHEIQQVRADRLRLVVQESDLQQEIAEMETMLGEPALEAGNRAKLATAKADLEGSRLGVIYAEQQAIAQQEAGLTGRLKQEQQRLQELSERHAKSKG